MLKLSGKHSIKFESIILGIDEVVIESLGRRGLTFNRKDSYVKISNIGDEKYANVYVDPVLKLTLIISTDKLILIGWVREETPDAGIQNPGTVVFHKDLKNMTWVSADIGNIKVKGDIIEYEKEVTVPHQIYTAKTKEIHFVNMAVSPHTPITECEFLELRNRARTFPS